MHRVLLNQILAFCGEHPRFPHPFLDQGYTDDVIVEREMRNQEGDEVQFDIILNSQAQGSVLLMEIKGGMSHEEARERFQDQRQRYSNVAVDDVVQQSGVSLPEEGSIRFDISYCCPAEVAEHLKEEVRDGDPEVIITFGLDELRNGHALRSCKVARNQFHEAALNDALDFNCDPSIPIPDHFFPFDENTHPLTIAFEIMPFIRTLYGDENRETFEHTELAERAIRVWPYFSREYRGTIGSVVRRVVTAIANAPGDPKYHWDNTERAWRFEESAHARATRTPPRLNKPAQQYLANEWDVDQIDAFFDDS